MKNVTPSRSFDQISQDLVDIQDEMSTLEPESDDFVAKHTSLSQRMKNLVAEIDRFFAPDDAVAA